MYQQQGMVLVLEEAYKAYTVKDHFEEDKFN